MREKSSHLQTDSRRRLPSSAHNPRLRFLFSGMKYLFRLRSALHLQPLTCFLSCSPLTSFPGDSDGKESACKAGDLGSIPGLERYPGDGNGTPLLYACLENSMDRGSLWATVHGVAQKSDMTEWVTHTCFLYIKKKILLKYFFLWFYSISSFSAALEW